MSGITENISDTDLCGNLITSVFEDY